MTAVSDRTGAGTTTAGSGFALPSQDDRVAHPLLDARIYADVGPLVTESGARLDGVTMAYETWGRLNPLRDNAILVLHALTGDSHVVGPAGPHHPTPGWWDGLIGPGAPLDSERFFVIAANVLGGCRGTTGPSSVWMVSSCSWSSSCACRPSSTRFGRKRCIVTGGWP